MLHTRSMRSRCNVVSLHLAELRHRHLVGVDAGPNEALDRLIVHAHVLVVYCITIIYNFIECKIYNVYDIDQAESPFECAFDHPFGWGGGVDKPSRGPRSVVLNRAFRVSNASFRHHCVLDSVCTGAGFGGIQGVFSSPSSCFESVALRVGPQREKKRAFLSPDAVALH